LYQNETQSFRGRITVDGVGLLSGRVNSCALKASAFYRRPVEIRWEKRGVWRAPADTLCWHGDLHASCHHAAKQHRLRDQTTLETSEKPAFMDAHY